ncbi:hypothetical protein XSR1_520007 [Xenorhabdus szentirmaii DSM 16338]|uniref:Uncharacterized protein n=1 Tax=Xenorhabdus szentirmaii DSM 16338 TaxID=1427518 RepID=W1J5Q2_9GAMM|nr:hypothetical protein XSR1_520007 [Xenorhabdus szentirmaii DSM 16338]
MPFHFIVVDVLLFTFSHTHAYYKIMGKFVSDEFIIPLPPRCNLKSIAYKNQ